MIYNMDTILQIASQGQQAPQPTPINDRGDEEFDVLQQAGLFVQSSEQIDTPYPGGQLYNGPFNLSQSDSGPSHDAQGNQWGLWNPEMAVNGHVYHGPLTGHMGIQLASPPVSLDVPPITVAPRPELYSWNSQGGLHSTHFAATSSGNDYALGRPYAISGAHSPHAIPGSSTSTYLVSPGPSGHNYSGMMQGQRLILQGHSAGLGGAQPFETYTGVRSGGASSHVGMHNYASHYNPSPNDLWQTGQCSADMVTNGHEMYRGSSTNHPGVQETWMARPYHGLPTPIALDSNTNASAQAGQLYRYNANFAYGHHQAHPLQAASPLAPHTMSPQDHGHRISIQEAMSIERTDSKPAYIEGLPIVREGGGSQARLIMAEGGNGGSRPEGTRPGMSQTEVVQTDESIDTIDDEEEGGLSEVDEEQEQFEKMGYEPATAVINRGRRLDPREIGSNTALYYSSFPVNQAPSISEEEPKPKPGKGSNSKPEKKVKCFTCRFEARLKSEGILEWEALGKPCGKKIRYQPTWRRHIEEMHFGLDVRHATAEERFRLRWEKHRAALTSKKATSGAGSKVVSMETTIH
ncbi:hypothetical protein FRC17_001355 [Serendipita sp. 399]|nr:hypothetical protein FRC17_001355 [Serendipita sp. 399]